MSETWHFNQVADGSGASSMSENMRTDIFSLRDLEGVIRLVHQLSRLQPDRGNRTVNMTRGIKQLLRAEAACVYESRGRETGLMMELHRDGWRDWQTDQIVKCLNGRKLSELMGGYISMDWFSTPDKESRSTCWHCVLSCLPAGTNYAITLAFARRAQAFSEREALLLRAFHRSEAFELLSPKRVVVPALKLSQRMSEVLTGLLKGCSEKQIASGLYLSRHTVHAYVKMLYRRYGVNTRAELLSLSIDQTAKRGF
jgi:DNA-binding CsgD family transcriptional regulator